MPHAHAIASAPRQPLSSAARAFRCTLLSFSSSCTTYRHRDPGLRPRRPAAPRTARCTAARPYEHFVRTPRHALRHTRHTEHVCFMITCWVRGGRKLEPAAVARAARLHAKHAGRPLLDIVQGPADAFDDRDTHFKEHDGVLCTGIPARRGKEEGSKKTTACKPRQERCAVRAGHVCMPELAVIGFNRSRFRTEIAKARVNCQRSFQSSAPRLWRRPAVAFCLRGCRQFCNVWQQQKSCRCHPPHATGPPPVPARTRLR